MIRVPGIEGVRVLAARMLHSWRRDEYARLLTAELEAHLALHTADRVREGLPRAEAIRDARLQLGGELQTRERCLDAMTFRWMVRWFGEGHP